MNYIATSNSTAIEKSSTTYTEVLELTDELIDQSNIDYIKTVNQLRDSLVGSYSILTDEDAAEVNDMLQYWGAIHLFGQPTIPYTTVDYRIVENNKRNMELVNLLNNIEKSDYTTEQEQFQELASIIIGE